MPRVGDHREAGMKEFSMSEESVVRDLFDRWERVWHEGQYDLVAEMCGTGLHPARIGHSAGDAGGIRGGDRRRTAGCGRTPASSCTTMKSSATARGSALR